MIILTMALAGLKSIDTYFARANCERSVAHLSDVALADIGLARKGKRIVAVSSAHAIPATSVSIEAVKDSESTVIMIPHYLCEDGG